MVSLTQMLKKSRLVSETLEPLQAKFRFKLEREISSFASENEAFR